MTALYVLGGLAATVWLTVGIRYARRLDRALALIDKRAGLFQWATIPVMWPLAMLVFDSMILDFEAELPRKPRGKGGGRKGR